MKTRDIALLDMDGTLLSRRTVDTLCDALGLSRSLREIDQAAKTLPAYGVTEEITRLFSGTAKKEMERVFDSIPLSTGAKELVNFFKELGFTAALVTDSYQFLAERLASRLDLDMTYGNIVEIHDGTLTGKLLTERHCLKVPNCREHSVCKLWFLMQLKDHLNGLIVSVGDSDSDICMTLGADIGVAYRPKSPRLEKVARIVVTDFGELIDLIDNMVAGLRRSIETD